MYKGRRKSVPTPQESSSVTVMMDNNRNYYGFIFLLAVFFSAAAVTSKDYCFLSTGVACSKSNIATGTNNDDMDDNGGVVQNSSMENTTNLNEEQQWNQIRKKACPNQIPNPSIWQILFEQAQIELGFDFESIPNTPKDIAFVKNFFTFSSGGVGYSSLDGEHHMVYLKVWKAANDQIRKNIERVAKKDNIWNFDVNIIDLMQNGERDFSELWSAIPLLNRNQTCVVTAVREPVEHFLSAYNEIEFRSTTSFLSSHGVKANGKKERYYERYKNGTDARFEQYVSEFIWGATSTHVYPSLPFSNIFHSFSQTGVLWILKEQVDILGVNAPRLTAYLPSISNVSAEFPNLVATNCPGFEEEFGRPFTKQFSHPSQKDEFGFYAAAKRVWSKQDATSRALCAIHLMDYACFDFSTIPALCQDVFSDASFKDRLLTQPTSTTSTTTSPTLNNGEESQNDLLTLQNTSQQESKEEMDTKCTFCDGGDILDLDLVVPQTGGNTCGSIKSIAAKEGNGTDACATIQKEERVCCPTNQQVGDDD